MELEQFEEMCAAYCLGVLSPDERMTFERALANATPEQRAVFNQMQLASRHLPLSNELISPNENVKNKIMSQIGASATATQFQVADDTVEISSGTTVKQGILGKLKSFDLKGFKNIKIDSQFLETAYQALRFDQPVVALSVPLILLLTCSILYFEQADIKSEYEAKMIQQEQTMTTQNVELQNTKARFAELENKLQEQDKKIAELDKKSIETTQMIAAKEKEMTDMKTAAAQSQEMMALMQAPDLKVADLRGLTPTPQARAKVMFSPKTKMAYIHVSNMPKAPANKDYQLWMMEGSKPVSAGVLAMSEGGSLVKVSTGLVVPIAKLSAFAVTLEPKGGVTKPTGTMYLKGNVKL